MRLLFCCHPFVHSFTHPFIYKSVTVLLEVYSMNLVHMMWNIRNHLCFSQVIHLSPPPHQTHTKQKLFPDWLKYQFKDKPNGHRFSYQIDLAVLWVITGLYYCLGL